MNVKYNINDRPWTISLYSSKYRVEQCTIERIESNKDRIQYKMKEGCSYWRTEPELFVNKSDADKKCIEINEVMRKEHEAYDEFDLDGMKETAADEGRSIRDGIYDVTDIPAIEVHDGGRQNNREKVKEFIKEYPNFYVASAYETETVIFLAKKPSKIGKKSEHIGSGFNYGSTNLIRNCPRDILILAEND